MKLRAMVVMMIRVAILMLARNRVRVERQRLGLQGDERERDERRQQPMHVASL